VRSPESRQVLAALAAVVLWSTNAFAADEALARMSVGWLLLTQYGAAAGALLIVRTLERRRGRRTPGTLSARIVTVGVLGLTGTILLQYLGFASAPIVAANVLSYAWPLLAAVWVAVTVRTRRSASLAGLAVLGFVGVVLIFTAQDAVGTHSMAVWGCLAALGSALCMATFTVASARLDVPVTDLLLPATLVGTAVAAALTAANATPLPTPFGLLVAAYIGIGPMAAGYGLWTMAISRDGAERLSPIGYATPLLSTLLLLATGAPATATTLTGVGLILACSVGVLAAGSHTLGAPGGTRTHTGTGLSRLPLPVGLRGRSGMTLTGFVVRRPRASGRARVRRRACPR
jgi:drug/metabolite transporter (DMT)-like permease